MIYLSVTRDGAKGVEDMLPRGKVSLAKKKKFINKCVGSTISLNYLCILPRTARSLLVLPIYQRDGGKPQSV